MRGRAITGSGSSHEEACEVLKEEVQRHLINLKVKNLPQKFKMKFSYNPRNLKNDRMYLRKRRMQGGRRSWSG